MTPLSGPIGIRDGTTRLQLNGQSYLEVIPHTQCHMIGRGIPRWRPLAGIQVLDEQRIGFGQRIEWILCRTEGATQVVLGASAEPEDRLPSNQRNPTP